MSGEREIRFCPIAGKLCNSGDVGEIRCQFWGAQFRLNFEEPISGEKYKKVKEMCLIANFLERR